MDKDLKYLYDASMKVMLKSTSSIHFFTQEEFDKNYATIMLLSASVNAIEKKINDLSANILKLEPKSKTNK